MKKIYYIGEEDLTRNSAGGARIINNCKSILKGSKFITKIIGYSDKVYFKKDSLDIYNVKRGKNVVEKMFYYLFRGLFLVNLLKGLNQKPDIIIYYGYSTRILLPVFLYCKKYNIKLIVDVVEWQDYSHLPLGKYGPIAFDVHYALTRLIPKCDAVICISTYLDNYYQLKGMKTLLIPIIIDINDKDEYTKEIPDFNNDSMNLIYAGFAGKKDLIMNVINAVESINKEGISVKLHLLGTTKEQLHANSNNNKFGNIIFYGILPQKDVLSYLKKADFSVLLRPDKRYSNAGFPTKFVESMAAGIPIIANLTSDLKYYIKDGYNGIVVENYSIKALVKVLKDITKKDKSHFVQLKQNARNTAVEKFDLSLYSERFNDFLTEIAK